MPVPVVLSTVQFMYLYRTTSLMSRILFELYFELNAEVLHGNTTVYWILHLLKRLITSARNFHRKKSQQLCWFRYFIWIKDFILKFSISGSFFPEKESLNLYTMMLFSFPVGGCVGKVVDNRTNYQGNKYKYFLQYRTLTVIHFMNDEGVF